MDSSFIRDTNTILNRVMRTQIQALLESATDGCINVDYAILILRRPSTIEN
jgi:hypothetical protein